MKGWKQSTLGAIAEADGCCISTGPFGSQLHKHDYEEEGIGVVNPTHIEQWKVCHESVPRISAANAERLSKHRLRPNDLLFARRGEIGRHAVISEDERDWLCGTGCFVVRIAQPQVEPRFVSYFLSTDESIEWLKRHAGGVVMPNLSNTVLQRVPVVLPPLPEQKKIAHILSTVQRAIEEQERIIQTTIELKKALMHKLFTEGLCNETQKQTEIGLIPESWEVVPLEAKAESFQYGTSVKCGYKMEGKPVLRIPNVVGGHVDPTDLKFGKPKSNELGKLTLHPGDLLFVRTNGVKENAGRCSKFNGELEDCYFASYLIRVRFNSKIMDADFVSEYSRTEVGTSMLSGRSIRTADGKFNINSGTLKTLLVPVPTIDEQVEIAKTFHIIDKKAASAQAKKANIQDLFRTLLLQLMTGKFV